MIHHPLPPYGNITNVNKKNYKSHVSMKFNMRILTILLLASSTCYGQLKIDQSTGLYAYSGIDQVDTTAQQLYSKGLQWYFSVFQTKPEFQDPDNFTFTSHPAFRAVTGGIVKYKLTVQFKDGRYKYNATDFIHYYKTCTPSPLESDKPSCSTSWGNFNPKKKWDDVRDQAGQTVIDLINNLHQSLIKPEETW